MTYSIDIYDCAADVPNESWNPGMVGAGVSMKLGYLALIEELHRSTIGTFYVVVSDTQGTAGLLYFQLVNFRAAYLRNFMHPEATAHPVWRLFLAIMRRLLRFLSWNLLLSGNIFLTGERGTHFHQRVPKEAIPGLLRSAFERIRRRSAKKVEGFMFNNIYDLDDSGVRQLLEEDRWGKFPVDPDMFLMLRPEWKTFRDYQQAMISKYRVRQRKVGERSAGVECRELDETAVKENGSALYALYRQTAGKAAFNLGYLDSRYFPAMKSSYGNRFHILAYFQNERLIGFMSAWRMNGDLDANYMGIDYDVSRDLKLYNRMLIDLVRLALEYRCNKVHLGRTATEIKSTIGAVPEPMHIYLSTPAAWKRKLLPYMEPYFGSPQYTIRHPFKKLPE